MAGLEIEGELDAARLDGVEPLCGHFIASHDDAAIDANRTLRFLRAAVGEARASDFAGATLALSKPTGKPAGKASRPLAVVCARSMSPRRRRIKVWRKRASANRVGTLSKLTEIRIHGRGGQGSVVAAYLLAATAIHAGYEAQAFPAFGAERRGAPVTAFVRISRSPIRRRAEIEHPDFLIVQDAKLLQLPGTTGGLAADGGVLVNAESEEALSGELRSRFRVVAVAASRIAEEAIGKRVPNVPARRGADRADRTCCPAESLYAALADRFDTKVAAQNRVAAERALAAIPIGAWSSAKTVPEVA